MRVSQILHYHDERHLRLGHRLGAPVRDLVLALGSPTGQCNHWGRCWRIFFIFFQASGPMRGPAGERGYRARVAGRLAPAGVDAGRGELQSAVAV
jgi:hypothetical protein